MIPGYLVVAVVLYCHRHHVKHAADRAQLRTDGRGARTRSEAEFRYALTRLRENGESIAILGGEKEERAGLPLTPRQA